MTEESQQSPHLPYIDAPTFSETDDCKDELDEFFDAESECSDDRVFEMTLDVALEEAMIAINYFFNNKFDEARSLLKMYANTSMYHSMGNSVFLFLEAILTFEQQKIENASKELKKCEQVCNNYRRKTTLTQAISNKFKKSNYSNLTDLESHAELCAAEILLLQALLTFIEDETLTSLIRGGIKIKQCYGAYKECSQILEQREWNSATSRAHFQSGVCMGLGTFNLMVSLLPTRVIKLLEFIGFSGNKGKGLSDLKNGSTIIGLRQELCSLTLLGYHLIVCYVLSHQEGDLQLCHEILEGQLKAYPNGVFVLFFKGRLEFMKGDLDKAQYWYKKSLKSQELWPQFHHISYWELLWVNCLKLDWRKSSSYATYLLKNSNWSRTIYSYQKAAILLMLNNATPGDQHEIDQLMSDVPKYKQRIAGKSLPMEKFICKKAARYFEQDRTLCLPAIELMYIWNTFKILGKSQHLAEGIFQLIDTKLKIIYDKQQRDKMTDIYDFDNFALCLLLRGSCYRQMKKFSLAIQDFEECISLKNNIKDDTYLVPYACVEVALIYAEENHIKAITALEEARKKYSGYSLESRLHFKIHTALMELKEK